MTKSALVGQLRMHAVTHGASRQNVHTMSDDEILAEFTPPCSWCGKQHLTPEKLKTVIEISLDEKHFRGLRNDFSNAECKVL